MEMELKEEVGGKPLSIQTGKVAKQASGSVVVQHGDTTVLVTVVSALNERPTDFLPLSVEYQEKIYAAGRIPGNYFRREIGRPSEKETLTARLIDRPIRPLFGQFLARIRPIVVDLGPKFGPNLPKFGPNWAKCWPKFGEIRPQFGPTSPKLGQIPPNRHKSG